MFKTREFWRNLQSLNRRINAIEVGIWERQQCELELKGIFAGNLLKSSAAYKGFPRNKLSTPKFTML